MRSPWQVSTIYRASTGQAAEGQKSEAKKAGRRPQVPVPLAAMSSSDVFRPSASGQGRSTSFPDTALIRQGPPVPPLPHAD